MEYLTGCTKKRYWEQTKQCIFQKGNTYKFIVYFYIYHYLNKHCAHYKNVLKTFCLIFSGAKMAYVEFNDQDVKEFVYPKYGNPEDPLSNRYPKNIRIKYPKTGTTNPSIKINVFDDLTSDSPSELNVEAPVDLGKFYIFIRDDSFNNITYYIIN